MLREAPQGPGPFEALDSKNMKQPHLALALLTASVLCACSDGLKIPRTPTKLIYNGTTGDVPIPNDAFFATNSAASNLDATLNFPPAEDVAQQPLFTAMNSLDGWSTTAPMSFHFSRPINASTVMAGSSVRLFEVDADVHPISGLKIGTPVNDVLAELVAGVDFVVAAAPSDPSGATWSLLPVKPLKPKTIYMFVVTSDVQDTDDFEVEAGSSYMLAKADTVYPEGHPALGLQALVSAMESVVSSDIDVSPVISEETVVAAVSFTTQSTFDVLASARLVSMGLEQTVLDAVCAGAAGHTACAATPVNTLPAAMPGMLEGTTDSLGGTMGADVYSASLTLPYYLTAAPNPGGTLVQSTLPLTENWRARFSYLEGTASDPMETEKNLTRYNHLPLETGVETVPVLISLPNVDSGQVQPVSGWPVVIYQHGFTGQRSDMLAIAPALAAEGFAVVAIDLPLHGIVASGGLHVGVTEGMLRERTFGLDLLMQTDGVTTGLGLDGIADTSGAHFINLSSLQTTRDNLRQGVIDLVAVVKMIQDNIDVDGDSMIVADDFDPTQIHFIGHSLGAIVGTTFAALDAAGQSPALVSATLFAPGGGIPRMLEASVTFGPIIVAGLEADGASQGTPAFDLFMFAAQSVFDSGDPINFGTSLNGGPLPIMTHEIVGGGMGGGLPDQVIPNSATGAPLAGTNPLIAAMGLTAVTVTTATTAAVVRFSEGTHSSLLDPDPDLDSDPENLSAFVEIQSEIAAWVADISMTPTVTITDTTVIAP
ncbi:MAG: pimeloyl-ACP methyl ester carboxylesterase [Planctomycetota bacterium]|jgi:pimeloyl-ACP methyl ester carboxylesterase